MLSFEQMLARLTVALVLGMFLGVEREFVHKQAGTRTQMLVAGGSALFAMVGLTLPYITASALGTIPDATSVNAGIGLIANIVVGIGFLGAGIIVKLNNHPHGVTTAADVWATAAVGALVGIGLLRFATVATFLIILLLYLLRQLKVQEQIEGKPSRKKV